MPDMGIGEAIGGLVSGLAGAAPEAAAAAVPVAAEAAPALAADVGTSVVGAGLPAVGGLGDIVGAGVPGALAPTVEQGAGMSLVDLASNTLAAPAIGSTGAIAGVDFGTSALPAGMGAGLPITSSIGDLSLQPSVTNAAFDPNFQSMSALSGQTPGATPTGTPGASPFSPGGVSAPAAPTGAAPVDVASASALPASSTPTGSPAPAGSGSSFTPVAAPSATAPAGVPTPAAATPTPNALDSFMKDPLGTLGSGAVKSVTSNPLGILAGLGGLGYSMLSNKNAMNTPNMQALNANAADQAAQAKQLSSYIQSGGLPPGLAAEVATATSSAKASIISGYASKGESTDPQQNSALAQDLAAVDERAAATQGQLATQLLSAGQTSANMSDQLYQTLVGIDQTNTQNMGKAIANFASSLAGRTTVPGTSVTIGTNTA